MLYTRETLYSRIVLCVCWGPAPPTVGLDQPNHSSYKISSLTNAVWCRWWRCAGRSSSTMPWSTSTTVACRTTPHPSWSSSYNYEEISGRENQCQVRDLHTFVTSYTVTTSQFTSFQTFFFSRYHFKCILDVYTTIGNKLLVYIRYFIPSSSSSTNWLSKCTVPWCCRCCLAGLGYPKGNIPEELVSKAKVDVSHALLCLWSIIN